MAVDIDLALPRDTRETALPTTQKLEFSAAEIGALAHLYRGEVYRSTVWRTRLDEHQQTGRWLRRVLPYLSRQSPING